MSNPSAGIHLARFCGGLLILACAGCQTYSPYGYGGYGGYSGTYSSPYYQQSGVVVPYGQGVLPPGGTTVIPPQPMVPGARLSTAPPYVPGAVTPPTPYPNVPSRPLPQGVDNSGENLGQQAPFPNVPSRPSMPPDEGLVPNYTDPGTAGPRQRPAPTVDVGDPADINSELNGAQRATEKLKVMENESLRGKSAMMDSDFESGPLPPVVPARAVRGGAIIQTATHQGGRHLHPYGHADDGRAWFRGVVDFDEQEKLWYLIYNPEPSAQDIHGGMISLIEHPHLHHFKPDDVILVEGDFDPSVVDHQGHPKYRIRVVRRLVQ